MSVETSDVEMFDRFGSYASPTAPTYTQARANVHGYDQAHFEAHIGSLRKDPASNLLYLGYTFGTTDAQLIQPYKRTVKGGDCHGTTRGQIARGFTNLEVAKIDQGLEAYAFKKAAANIS